MRHRVLFIASEYAPLAKAGGLADVSSALSRTLHDLGHDVRVFLPYYRSIATQALPVAPVANGDGTLALGRHRYDYRILTTRAPGSSLALYLIDCPALYDRPELYSNEPDEHRRFLLLTRAALETASRTGFAPDIVHCHDWHTGFGPLFLKTLYAEDPQLAKAKSVMTIHNIGYQGIFGSQDVGDLSLDAHLGWLHQDELRAGRINALLHGCVHADLITTVSPTYAEEITTPRYGEGLDPILRSRRADLLGILNGVDYAEWSPDRDPLLPIHFSAALPEGKARLRGAFAERLGLNLGSRTMLLGLVSRLASQKGLDLLPDALPELLATRDLAFVALGAGESRYEGFLEHLAATHPGRVVFHRGYSNELAHWIEGACDAFLMPSRYEPCGLNQMYSLRYGTIPIVRRTGGLADSVTHYDPATRLGTGIVFNDYDAPALRWALDTALGLYAEPMHWQILMGNAMREDFSWPRQAERYVEAYDRLSATR
jgi:starch synthase